MRSHSQGVIYLPFPVIIRDLFSNCGEEDGHFSL